MVETWTAGPQTQAEVPAGPNQNKPRPWLVPALAALVLGIALGGLGSTLLGGSEEASGKYQKPDPIVAGYGSAPAPAWTDVAAACDHLRPLIEQYGGEPGGFPFSEVGWLVDLVDTTELMGANGTFFTSSFDTPEDHIAGLASQLRTVAIGGGLSHPKFPTALADLMDACDAYQPTI